MTTSQRILFHKYYHIILRRALHYPHINGLMTLNIATYVAILMSVLLYISAGGSEPPGQPYWLCYAKLASFPAEVHYSE